MKKIFHITLILLFCHTLVFAQNEYPANKDTIGEIFTISKELNTFGDDLMQMIKSSNINRRMINLFLMRDIVALVSTRLSDLYLMLNIEQLHGASKQSHLLAFTIVKTQANEIERIINVFIGTLNSLLAELEDPLLINLGRKTIEYLHNAGEVAKRLNLEMSLLEQNKEYWEG